MREVLGCAQQLGEAILNSSIYQRMKKAEAAVEADPAATAAVAAYMEKRAVVEELLAQQPVDPQALSEAGLALEEAEKAINELAIHQELEAARQEYNNMMNSINQILNVIVTGQLGNESSGCTGSCASCGGCGRN